MVRPKLFVGYAENYFRALLELYQVFQLKKVVFLIDKIICFLVRIFYIFIVSKETLARSISTLTCKVKFTHSSMHLACTPSLLKCHYKAPEASDKQVEGVKIKYFAKGFF